MTRPGQKENESQKQNEIEGKIKEIIDLIIKHQRKATGSCIIDIGLDLVQSFLAAKEERELRSVRIWTRGLMSQHSAHPDSTFSARAMSCGFLQQSVATPSSSGPGSQESVISFPEVYSGKLAS